MGTACKLLSFDAAKCVEQLLAGWIGAIPTDWLLWAAFLAGLVLGSVIGWRRLLAIGVAIALYKLIFDRGARDAPAEEIYPPPEKPRTRWQLPDIFGRSRAKGGGDISDWIGQ